MAEIMCGWFGWIRGTAEMKTRSLVLRVVGIGLTQCTYIFGCSQSTVQVQHQPQNERMHTFVKQDMH